MAPVFTNLTLRFTLLRIVCVSTILLLIESLVRIKPYFQAQHSLIYYVVLAIFGLIIVHHGTSAFGPRFSLPCVLDIFLFFVEIVLCLPGKRIAAWYPREIVLYFTLLCTTWAALVLLVLLRIGEAFQRGRRYLWTRYDITGAKWAHGRESESGNAGVEGAGISEPLKAYHVLFGTTLWKVHFPGESRAIIISRGLLGVLLIVAIPIFSVVVLIIEPVYETGLIPFKGMKSHGLAPQDFRPTDQPVWNVIITRSKLWVEGGDNNPDFSPAVSVTPLWNSNFSNPPCALVPDAWPQAYLGKYAFDRLLFHCPPRIQIPIELQKQFILYDSEDIRPDLLIRVNFTMMDVSSTSILDGAINSVQIMLGLTNNTADVLQTTSPTMLLPGMNVVGITKLSIRQKFRNAAVAALGIESYDTLLISEIVDILPDPQASISKLIPRSPEIATMRIISFSDFSEVTIVQDYREKSISKGFATIGGLWTFLGGVFSALFGSSIVRILFGSKPISVFGLTRSFKRDSIREACLQAYPRLISDLKTKPEDRGLVSFISDHLVDFAFLTGRTGNANSDPDENSGTNPVQETAIPLLPRSVTLQAHSPGSFQNYDVGLRIWGIDPNERRMDGH